MRVLLCSPPHGANRPDPFVGVAGALAARGIDADRHLIHGPPPTLPEGTRLIAVSDALHPTTRTALRLAHAARLPAMLLMDGVVEWRNTFRNPRVGPSFLNPAPVHAVACAGGVCAEVLIELGNNAWATGLPRLDAAPRELPAGERLLVATARRPWFDEDERARLTRAIANVRDGAHALGIPVLWRLTCGLGDALGVRNDPRPLPEALADARAVLTTPSTLVLESMLAGRPTGVIDAFGAPVWHETPWVWDAAYQAALPGVLASLLAPDDERVEAHARSLAAMHPADHRSAERVAAVIADLAHDPPRESAPAIVPLTVRPEPVAAIENRPRVLHLVQPDPDAYQPVPVAVFADGTAPASHDWDEHTLFLTDVGVGIPGRVTGRASVCVVERDLDHTERLRIAIEAALALEPTVAVAWDSGLASMVARALSVRGVRAITDARAGDAVPARIETAAAARDLPGPTDAHLNPPDAYRWTKHWADDPARAEAVIREELALAGYRRIVTNPSITCEDVDAAVFTAPVTPEIAERAERLRARGVGVALSPALTEPEWSRLARAARRAQRAGASRIAVYGAGDHTRRAERAFGLGLPIVGFIDDRPAAGSIFGLPVVPMAGSIATLRPDAVILSSDTWEAALWMNAAPLREAGVPVIALYGAESRPAHTRS